MLEDDFTQNRAADQSAMEPKLSELEKKYEKELNEYEQKTHFMQEHESDFSNSSAEVEQSNETYRENFSAEETEENSYEPSEEFEGSTPITVSEIMEVGSAFIKEKAADAWESVKSEWKADKKQFLRKALVGTAVTGAAVGLILLSRRKKTPATFLEKLQAA